MAMPIVRSSALAPRADGALGRGPEPHKHHESRAEERLGLAMGVGDNPNG
jgi:hypothetical protein